MDTVTIHRRTKHEAERAIDDLLKRGYTITFDLTEKKTNHTSLSGYNHVKGKFTSITASVGTVWWAKLKRSEIHGIPHT